MSTLSLTPSFSFNHQPFSSPSRCAGERDVLHVCEIYEQLHLLRGSGSTQRKYPRVVTSSLSLSLSLSLFHGDSFQLSIVLLTLNSVIHVHFSPFFLQRLILIYLPRSLSLFLFFLFLSFSLFCDDRMEDVLREWHSLYPVTEAERQRNDVIFTQYQNTRNPFVDDPDLVPLSSSLHLSFSLSTFSLKILSIPSILCWWVTKYSYFLSNRWKQSVIFKHFLFLISFNAISIYFIFSHLHSLSLFLSHSLTHTHTHTLSLSSSHFFISFIHSFASHRSHFLSLFISLLLFVAINWRERERERDASRGSRASCASWNPQWDIILLPHTKEAEIQTLKMKKPQKGRWQYGWLASLPRVGQPVFLPFLQRVMKERKGKWHGGCQKPVSC